MLEALKSSTDTGFQLMNILNKIFGSSNSRKLKKMNKIVTAINAFEQELEQLSDEQLSGKTGEFAQKLEAGRISAASCPKHLRWSEKPVSGP